MKKIYKYKLQITDSQTVELPGGSEILTVQVQNGDVVLWALVETDASPVMRHIEIIGTGFIIDSIYEQKYISTCQMSSGLVWHFFETIL